MKKKQRSLQSSLEENKKETSRLTEENISYEKEQKLLQSSCCRRLLYRWMDISGKLEELKQQRSTAMKKQNQIFQELERENDKLLILEKEAAKLSSRARAHERRF